MKKVAQYFDAVFGEAHSFEAFRPSVPLFLDRYSFYRAKVLGVPLVLAIVDRDEQTPLEYRDVGKRLADKVGMPVVFVFEALMTNKRNALLRHRVPFVIPGRQFFLPPLFELREREPRGIAAGERLHYPAQAVLLRELVAGDVASQSLKDLGVLLGFSAMSMTTAANELKAHGLAEIRGAMPRHVVFPIKGKALWEKARIHLTSPVKRRIYLAEDRAGLPVAGISALARRSMLNSDRQVTRAIGETDYKGCLPLKTVETLDEAESVLEVWGYDPLKVGGKEVDDFSLWLSLQKEAAVDPRVEGELDSMMEGRKWL